VVERADQTFLYSDRAGWCSILGCLADDRNAFNRGELPCIHWAEHSNP